MFIHNLYLPYVCFYTSSLSKESPSEARLVILYVYTCGNLSSWCISLLGITLWFPATYDKLIRNRSREPLNWILSPLCNSSMTNWFLLKWTWSNHRTRSGSLWLSYAFWSALNLGVILRYIWQEYCYVRAISSSAYSLTSSNSLAFSSSFSSPF